MAKLKIGSGLTIKAELPKLDQLSPKIGPSIVEKEQPAELDVIALVEKVMSMLPKPESTKEVVMPQSETDLSHLVTKTEMEANIDQLLDQNDKIGNRIDVMSSDIDAICTRLDDLMAEDVIISEVKQITHIKDVSPDVLIECEGKINQAKLDIMLKVQDLQKKNKVQKVINYILSGTLILTILIHLL